MRFMREFIIQFLLDVETIIENFVMKELCNQTSQRKNIEKAGKVL